MHYLPRGRALIVVALLGGMELVPARAAGPVDAQTVSLADAVSRTLEKNPALAAFPYRLRAADAEVTQASLRPSPALSLEIENLAGDAPADGIKAAEVTLALSQIIELGGKRHQRTSVASAALNSAGIAYEQARLDVLGEAVSRYVALAQAHSRLALSKQTLTLAQQAEQAAQRRVNAGAAPSSELMRLTLSRQQAEIDLRRAELLLQSASQRLAALWGESDQDSLLPASSLTPLPSLPSLAEIRTRLEHTPTLLAMASETRLREAQLRLAEANSSRDLTVSVGARHDRLSDSNSLLVGLSMPLNLRNPNRGNEASARAALAESEAIMQARQTELVAVLSEQYRALLMTQEEYELVESRALPLARQLYEDIEVGYRAGRYSLLELITARQERLTLEQRAIELAGRFHLQRNELERLTGQPFSAAGAQEIRP